MKRMISIAVVLFAACGSSGSMQMSGDDDDGPMPDAPAGDSSSGSDSGNPDGPTSTAQRTIFTIVLENHDYAEVVGSSNAPYINSLIAQGALATNYKDSGTHPSLPNYLFMASGATQYPGFIDLTPTFFPFPVKADNLGTQLEAANIKWRAYAEDASTGCNLTDAGEYATKHDPFLYFDDQQNGA